MIFCLYMYILMGKRLAVFLNSIFYFKVFWVKNAKIDFFKEKMVLRVVFMVCLTWKTPNNWNFAYGGFFTRF